MPIYEYRCDRCEREFEVEQRITEEPLRSCPQCRSRKLRRLISQTSFVLKGGGWYSDLYSSGKSKADGAAKESGGDAKPAGDAKSATNAKTAATPGAGEAKPAAAPKDPGPGGKGKKKSEGKAAA